MPSTDATKTLFDQKLIHSTEQWLSQDVVQVPYFEVSMTNMILGATLKCVERRHHLRFRTLYVLVSTLLSNILFFACASTAQWLWEDLLISRLNIDHEPLFLLLADLSGVHEASRKRKPLRVWD